MRQAFKVFSEARLSNAQDKVMEGYKTRFGLEPSDAWCAPAEAGRQTREASGHRASSVWFDGGGRGSTSGAHTTWPDDTEGFLDRCPETPPADGY